MTARSPPSFYLNIHTVSPSTSLTFFTSLGFTPIPAFSDEQTSALLLPAPNISIGLMLHAPSRFKQFMRPGTEINDATKTTEALFSLAVDTKEEVDTFLEKVVAAGGGKDPYKMGEDYGESCGMYTRSWTDLDGHLWEVVAVPKGFDGCGGEKEKKGE